jgi:hypothetical protein
MSHRTSSRRPALLGAAASLQLLAAAALLPAPALAAEATQETSPTIAGTPDPAPAEAPEGEEKKGEEKKGEEKKGEAKKEEKDKPWYERLSIRGYTQIRYNRLPSFSRNDELINEQGDRFLARNSGFGIRRARVIISGDLGDHLSVYLQPDFASVIGEQLNVTILRDWYADIFFDKAKEFRLRVGQSKVPFGFENLQSSSNRLALDRSESLNSALRDERDIGAFFYWAPAEVRARFKHLVDANLKGSGDYGVVGVGVYNGQNANRLERNENVHVVARVAYPLQLGNQIIEANLAAHWGRYVVALGSPAANVPAYTVAPGVPNNLRDARAAASFILYPQPFGVQAEYNIGVGPSIGTGDQATVVDSRQLRGGYLQLMYMLKDVLGTRSLTPYVRGTLYEGGKKFETNAPRYDIREVEAGAEWQFNKWIELTGAYLVADRTTSRYSTAVNGFPQTQGHVTRVQLQFNY